MMKYIVVESKGKEQIFIFPRIISHDRFLAGIEWIKMGDINDWNRDFIDAELIAAGFIDNGVCFGRSETLDIDSRGEQDTMLMKGD